MIKISPSVLTCDFSKLPEAIKQINETSADMIHLDIMDGEFVPNTSFEVDTIKELRELSNLEFDVHLMVKKPTEYIQQYIEAGADIITFHIESETDALATIKLIKSYKKKVGIAINPKTDPIALKKIADKVDLVLIMGVEPGFGGQKFIEETYDKIKKIKKMAKRKTIIQVDGGVNGENFEKIIKYGANSLVVGAYFFKSVDKAKTVEHLKGKN